MILMLAPAGNMTFASMPSGSTYVSNSYGLIKIDNGSVADQLALVAAGCTTLNPIPGGAATTQAGTAYAIQPADQGNAILFTANTGINVVLASTMPVGFSVRLFQVGTGQVTATADAGASIVSPGATATFGQYTYLLCLVVSNAPGTNAQWIVIAAPAQNGGLIGAASVAALYSQDTAAHYPQYTVAQVLNDTIQANNGVWLKTGAGSGSGNWTQESVLTLASLNNAIGYETTRAESAEAAAGRFEPSVGYEDADFDSSGKLIAYTDFEGARWQIRNGVAVPVGWKGGAAIPYTFDYTTTAEGFRNDPNVDYLICVYGNSIALGTDPGNEGTITTSAVDSSYAFMPLMPALPAGTAGAYGVYPSSNAFSDYQALRELIYQGSDETPCSGCASKILSVLNTNVGSKPRLVMLNQGFGGQGYAHAEAGPASQQFLRQGSWSYTNMLRNIQMCQAISKRHGRKLIVIGVACFWDAIEFDLNLQWEVVAGYYSQHQRNCDSDIRQITGQNERIRLYVSQCNRGYATVGRISEASWAGLKVTERDPNIRCVGPQYYLAAGSDGAHWTSQGYRTLGRQLGYFIANDYFGPGCLPLHITDSWWTASNVFCLRYSEPVSIDTAGAMVNVSNLTALGGLYGLDYTDNIGGTSSQTISAAAVIASPSGVLDTIQVTLTGPPARPPGKVFVAARITGSGNDGNLTGARSGIYSTASIDTDTIGSLATIYKWACHEVRNL